MLCQIENEKKSNNTKCVRCFSISDSLTLFIKNTYIIKRIIFITQFGAQHYHQHSSGSQLCSTNVVRLRNIDTAVRTTLQDLFTEVGQMLINSNERVSVFRVSFPTT